MELTDIAPLEAWAQIENDAFKKFNLQSSVFNRDGLRITGTKNWANKICPEIKSTDKGQTFICSSAHMNIANEARQTGKPVIEECDAGLVKIVIPIIVNNEFIGAAGGCGLLLTDGEVDTFAVNKIAGIDEKRIEALSGEIPTMTHQSAESVCDFFTDRINELVETSNTEAS